LLLALAVAVEHWLEVRAGGPSMRKMTIVAVGESGEYAGATWRLTRLRPGPPRRTVPLPDGAVVVYAGLTVTPHDAAASDRIEACVLRAVDGRGRTWGPASVLTADSGRGAESAAGCYRPTDGYEREPIPAGRSQRIRTAFLVPKDVLPDLAVRVLVRGEAPTYLQFES
jgi:hypothetical protein